MDNLSSQPTIEFPNIPSDFDARAGTSRRDMAVALVEVLQGSVVKGINNDNPAGFDLASLTALVLQLQQDLQDIIDSEPTKVTFTGVDDDSVVLNFADVGTSDYEVTVTEILASDATYTNWTWALVNGTRTPTSVKIRMNNANGKNCEAYIRPNV